MQFSDSGADDSLLCRWEGAQRNGAQARECGVGADLLVGRPWGAQVGGGGGLLAFCY